MMRERLGIAAVWAAIIALVFLLRTVFAAILLTFLLCYIGDTAVRFLTARFPRRRFNLVLIYATAISVLAASGAMLVPAVIGEARDLLRDYVDKDLENQQEVLTAYRQSAREPSYQRLQPVKLKRDPTSYHPVTYDEKFTNPPRQQVKSPIKPPPSVRKDTAGFIDREVQKNLDRVARPLLGEERFEYIREKESYEKVSEYLNEAAAGGIAKVIVPLRKVMRNLLRFSLQFLLATIFSFLILWDLDHLRSAARSRLFGARTPAAIQAVSIDLLRLGETVGLAFKAQGAVAVVNTILTAAGFILLGLPSVALLACIVFFCSFIPVLGVVLSTFPAAMIAFKMGGFAKVVALIVVILIAHAIEAYVINPLIYGHHLEIHPVAVLIILFVMEHIFGVWGLLLGVPVAAFLFERFFPKGAALE